MISLEEQLLLREKRHRKLLSMINSYIQSPQQAQHLQRVKKHTQMQIATRFIRSKQNKNYIFPVNIQDNQSNSEQYPARMPFQTTFYDLRAQNYIQNPMKKNTETDVSTTARRVKSLGTEKLEERSFKQIRRQLRQRPRQRQGKRQRIILPSLNQNIKSHRALTKIQQKVSSARQSPLRIIKSNKRLNGATQPLSKQKKQKRMNLLVETKLLTEEDNIFSIGNSKVIINRLKYPPSHRPLKSKKLITE